MHYPNAPTFDLGMGNDHTIVSHIMKIHLKAIKYKICSNFTFCLLSKNTEFGWFSHNRHKTCLQCRAFFGQEYQKKYKREKDRTHYRSSVNEAPPPLKFRGGLN